MFSQFGPQGLRCPEYCVDEVLTGHIDDASSKKELPQIPKLST